MNATAQNWQNQSVYPPKEGQCESVFLPVYARERLDSHAYAKRVGSIYIAVRGSSYKVGFSTRPTARAKEMGWKIVAIAQGRMADELGIHYMMSAFRNNENFREWYRPNQRLDGLINYISQVGSLPPEVVDLGDAHLAVLMAKAGLRACVANARGAVSRHERARKRMERDNG